MPVVDEAVTVTVQVEVLFWPRTRLHAENVSPEGFDVNVTLPIGLLFVPVAVSVTVIVKDCVPPGATVDEAGAQDVLVNRFGVRVKFTVGFTLLDAVTFDCVDDRKSS